MFSSMMYMLFSVIFYIFSLKACASDLLLPPSLYLYSPGELEFAEVVVKRAGDNLTLTCELRGAAYGDAVYWSHEPRYRNLTERPYTVERNGSFGSRLLKHELSVADSGRYICASPPFGVAKFIVVQEPSRMSCAHGAFVCGARCVLPAYVCDGRADCMSGEDEAADMCGERPCNRADRLNCSSGRCIPAAACCGAGGAGGAGGALCRQPACCAEHPALLARADPLDADAPVAYDDRHPPGDYGLVQTTIYTVTACALIFMIAVVLLVSAICKMHMKRAALRSYAHADRQTRAHYNMHYAQRQRFPPCYEASGLLELEHARSPLSSPTRHELQCGSPGASSPAGSERRTRLAALTSVFTSRYRQVPTQCAEVEMSPVSAGGAGAGGAGGAGGGSPARAYRSPAGARGGGDGAPALNAVNGDVHDHRLTLQLGRFQLSIPRFGRADPRPDTPNVTDIDIDDLDFVRLNSNETYTLNGRTIHLLGGNFENYPPTHASHPPPYNEAMRYKLYGPPPEYLSRDRLNRSSSVDEEARSNVEMPPGYEELGSGSNDGSNRGNDSGNRGNDSGNRGNDSGNRGNDSSSNPIVLDRNLIVISDLMAAGLNSFEQAGGSSINHNVGGATTSKSVIVASESNDTISDSDNNIVRNHSDDCITKIVNNNNENTALSLNNGVEANGNVESLNSVIDNLPAIDSDVNANDGLVGAVSC